MRRKARLFGRQLMNVDAVRSWLASMRWLYSVHLLKRLRTLAVQAASENTVSHNLGGMADLGVRRSLVLVRPLAAAVSITRPGQALEDSEFRNVRVLSVGPRTEGELLNLVGHGFQPELIRGLDLISYSPWVDLGDMHAMPYPDNQWDVVVMGWVLAYSDDKRKAAAEVVRVAKPGAIVAVGVEYCALSNEQIVEKYGYQPGSNERIWCVDDILGCFGEAVGEVYFRHDITPARKHEEAVALVAVFSIRK